LAFADQVFYCNAGDQSTTGHYAVAKFAASTAYSAGQLVRQFTAPSVGGERVFVVIVAGTSSTEPSWAVTRGAKNTSGGVTFQECTGASAVNGDLTNTANWTAMKALGAPTLGAIIQRNSGASYQICSTAGTMGASEPAFSNTAGTTTTEGTTTWTSLGPVGNFTGGQAPHARLSNACAINWFADGNTIYVGDNHAESSGAAITISPSSIAMARVVCHNHSGSYPPGAGDLATAATISTTSGSINISGAGSLYFYGVTFKAGVGFSGTANINIGAGLLSNIQNWYYFDNCSFWIATTGASSVGLCSNTSNIWQIVVFNKSTVKFATTAQFLNILNGQFVWQNTGQILASGSSLPLILFKPNTSEGFQNNMVLEGIDLSQVTGSLFSIGTNYLISNLVIKDCKLNASATITQPTNSGMVVQLVRCDSGAAAYKSSRITYEGTETTETTITRTGGAADPTGQAQSRKIVSTANAQWLRPFKAEPYAIWNPTTGSNVTVTVYGTVNSYYVPFNDEIWLEVEYLGASSSPLGTMVTTSKASVLASNLPVTADDSVWSGVSLLAAAEDDEPSPRTTYMTFDGAPTNVTLSNGNLTVTHPNTSVAGVNSSDFGGPAAGHVGVKQYFEITVQTSILNGNSVGYMTPTDPTTAPPAAGNNKTGVILGSSSSPIYTPNGVSTGKDLGAVAANDVIGVAWDGDNSLFWFRKNGGNWNGDPTANPATGAGGVFAVVRQSYTPYVAFAAGGSSTDVMKGNFGQTTFAFTAPSGFGAPDATGGGGGGGVAGWSSFKLVATLSSPQPGLAGYIHARVRVGKASATYYLDPKIVLS
jgi:hypothetical protein